ncbi:MAG: PKD domain-containing protein, partial [Thermoplasmata archaeon]|nr:PKD domain-containing protein [Thermoplasmata archaeon]
GDDIVLVVGDVMQKGLSAIKALATIIKVGKTAYDFLKITKFSKVFTEPLSSLKSFSKIYKTVGKVNTGFMKIVNKIGAVLDVIGLVIDIGIAIYCMFAIAESMDWSTVGVAMGVVYAVMMIVYAVVLFAIGLIPVVGWIIALVISLSDAITGWIFGKGWSQMLMEAIIDLITDFNTLTEANITMTGSETIIDDKDLNGLDVGDRIEYKSYVTGRINRTSDGHWRDVLQSYIIPSYTLSIPPNTGSSSGTYSDVADERFDPSYKYKETDYEVGAWFEPGIPMVNFPMTIAFQADMRTYSEECWWAVVWWCERKANTCSTTADPSTLYFDVMPGSIDEFAKWRGIHSNDYDGDGINNTDEERTDMWKWDTDGDGLGDNYEYEIGTIPWMYDSDRDGLDDKTEHLWGTDPDDKDTDDDGLIDYIEHNGWVVNFDYFDDNFNWHITSNPLLNNTDADAVNDYMEYRTLQNPMSKDTNGDGIEDQTKDYYDTQFVHRKNIAESFYPRAMAVDGNGNTYVATNKDSEGTYADCFVKYNKQGFMDTYYYEWGTNTLDRIEDMRMGPDGKLYVADRTHGILRFKPNGAYDNWRIYHIDQTGFYNPTAITFDGEGHLLAVSGFTHDVWVFNIAPAKPTVVDRWGGMSTTVDGKFDTPNGIDFHPDGYVYVSAESNRVQKLHPNGTHIATWRGTVVGIFNDVQDVDVDVDGNVFITDKGRHHILKVDLNGSWQKTLGAKGSADGLFEEPWEMTITPENDIYVVDSRNYRIQKMWQEVVFVPATPPVTFLDTDGDGFEDADEANEWTVTLVNASGTISFNVSSDIMVPDSDNDGLNDLKEFQLKTNPRSPDTDGDGVPDGEELAFGTNLTHWDTDNDGLDDAIEITFGSDPRLEDSDNDGLFDRMEWQYGSDPRSQDTDKDGLGDLEEALVASNLTNPDSDGDFMFDGMEADWGTSPTNPDWDGDGLDDGYEVFFSTDPKEGDTDGDNLLDAFELGMKMNPLSNDTDGDGLLDSTELDMGLNPKSRDSDGDGVPDNLDLDYAVELQQKVYLAIDPVGNMTRFIDGLIDLIGVEIVEPGTLLSVHKNARYIVLVGDPSSGPGTVGSVIRGLLEDTPDLLEQMETSDGYHIAVRYGTWAHTQTIVMISHPYPSDHIRVAGILRSMEMTVTDGAVAVTYLNPRSCFKLDDADTVRQTDTVVWTKLDEMATFSVEITKYTEDDTPYELLARNGLEPGDEVMGKYVSVEVSESIQTNLTDMVSGASLRLYYTEEDLDMTGDGDADDEGDLNELTLCLYRYDEETEVWEKVREDLSWVTEAGVNTTDVEMYGKEYAGYVYAEISHFSYFGAGGRPNTFLPTVANAGEDFDGLTHQIITFNGTTSEGNGELNYTWTLYHRSQLVTLYDPTPTFTFTEPGDYIVTLLVKDDYNVIDGDTVFVSIISLADEMFDLEVGPIVDVHGDPVEAAKVRVTVADFRFFGVTDAEGIADVEIAMAFQGREVQVFIVKSGHEPLKFDTNITMDGLLVPVPPTFYRELFEVVAHAGIDRMAYLGEETMLDGSLSLGNGGIAEYSWTFQHKGGKRVLEGATPTFVFEEESSYVVTLTVTDFRGLTAETTVTLTVVPRPTDEFTLFVGPLMDTHNLPIEGASVELTIGEEVYSGYTMADGVAYIVLPGDHKGVNVEVYIQGDDFAPISFFTIITPEGEMERAVPAVQSTADWTDPGETEGGMPAWVIGAIVAVIVALVLMFLILTKRIGGKKEDDLDDLGTDDEGTTEEAEPGTEEELEDATIVVDGPEEASVGEGPGVEPEEDLHVVTAPGLVTEEVPPKVDFKDLP